jgi:hypothetical protein
MKHLSRIPKVNGSLTDADTLCSSQSLSLAVENLHKIKHDILTLGPRIVSGSRWATMTLPVLWSFSHIKYSFLIVR